MQEHSGAEETDGASHLSRKTYVVNGKPIMLRRTSSLADVARVHKKHTRFGSSANDVRKFYQREDEEEDLSEEDPTYMSLPQRPPSDRESLEYLVRGHRGPRAPAESPNFLYRTGSRMWMGAGLELGEGHETHHSLRSREASAAPSAAASAAPSETSDAESDAESSDNDGVIQIGRNFWRGRAASAGSYSLASEQSSDDEWSRPRPLHALWRVIVEDVFAFEPTDAQTARDKQARRERTTGLDPTLILAVGLAMLS